MDFEVTKFLFDTVQTLLIAAIGIQSHLARREAATIASIEQLEDDITTKISEHSVKISQLETNAQHCPTHEDLARIYELIRDSGNEQSNKLTEVIKSQAEIVGEMRHINRDVSALRENELRKSGTGTP